MRAVVLSAGYGTRLGDLTAETPKPMLDVGGRPLLEWIIRHLASEGVTDVGVNLHFRPEVIRGHLGDGSALGVRLRYSEEAELQGTAGGVRGFGAWLREVPGAFVVQYGDILTDQSLTPLLELHRSRQAMATILVHQRARSNSIVELDADGRVLRFVERPPEGERSDGQSWVNSGLYVLDPAILDRIPPEGAVDFPRDVFPSLVEDGTLWAVPLTGYRCAIDSPERLAEARSALADGRVDIAWPV